MYISYMHLVEDLTSNKISGIFGQIPRNMNYIFLGAVIRLTIKYFSQ